MSEQPNKSQAMDEGKAEGREALDALNRNNLLLEAARMLPSDKPLTAPMIFAVIDRFTKYIEDREISMAQVAREISYAESVLSTWKSNTYKGDMDAVTRGVNNWMERDARRAAFAKPRDYVPTFVAETIRTIAFQADKQLKMAAIVAPAGSGKTKVLRVLTEQMRGIYLYVPQNMSEKEFLIQLAMALGRNADHGSKGSILRWVVKKLKDTRRIIFIDEAQNLGKWIGMVRSIHDEAAVPIVMAGTADILQMVNDRADGRGQFSSRTIRCNLMDFVANAEDPDGNAADRELFTLEEIKRFFDSRGMRLADDGMRFMWALACLPNYGTLRLAELVADLAADANRGVAVLTRQQLLAALPMVVGGEARYLKGLTERQEAKAKTIKTAKMA